MLSLQSSGIWPQFWLLGNLARPGYDNSTLGMWPYSFNVCTSATNPGWEQSFDNLLVSGRVWELMRCLRVGVGLGLGSGFKVRGV